MDLGGYIEYIKIKHNGQTRKQGTPYYTHPLQVAKILKDKGFCKEYQIVGLFHDLLEDTDTTYEDILLITNKDIANAVKLLTKEKGYNMEEYIYNISNNELAKMVKIADRIHNLSEAYLASKSFQEKYIKETTKWYIPLAKGTIFENDLKVELEKLIKNN